MPQADRERFEASAESQFQLAGELVNFVKASFPDQFRDSLLVSFTSQSYIDAQITGELPLVRIEVTMGLIEQVWRASEMLKLSQLARRSFERLMLAFTIAHEVGHLVAGHTEANLEEEEGRAPEAFVDGLAGAFVASLTLSPDDKSTDETVVEKLGYALLAALILLAQIDLEATATHHSTPVRFHFFIGGYYAWIRDNNPLLLKYADRFLNVDTLKNIVDDVVSDEDMKQKLLKTVVASLSSQEDVADTGDRIKKFLPIWFARSKLIKKD